jgi:hypothetical protein
MGQYPPEQRDWTMSISTHGFILILSAALVWTIGSVLIWWNLRRQEKLINELGRMCMQRLSNSPDKDREVVPEEDGSTAKNLAGVGFCPSDSIQTRPPMPRHW